MPSTSAEHSVSRRRRSTIVSPSARSSGHLPVLPVGRHDEHDAMPSVEAWAIDPPVRTTSSSGWAWKNTIVEAGVVIAIELAIPGR